MLGIRLLRYIRRKSRARHIRLRHRARRERVKASAVLLLLDRLDVRADDDRRAARDPCTNVRADDVVTAYERAYKRSKSCSVATAFELSDGHARERAYKRSKCCSVAAAFELSDGYVRGAANRG